MTMCFPIHFNSRNEAPIGSEETNERPASTDDSSTGVPNFRYLNELADPSVACWNQLTQCDMQCIMYHPDLPGLWLLSSLSLITTDLSPDQEAHLQQFLCKRLTKGSILEDSSHIGSVDLKLVIFELFNDLFIQACDIHVKP